MGALKLSQVDLNLLVALDALLRERNVTRAGRQIGLSQPAMSAALARLRDMFNDKLFERVGSGYRLTPFAEALAAPLQVALTAVERTLERDATFDPGTAKRRFRIALSDHLLLVLCPPLVERLNQAAPGVQLHVQQATPEVGKDLASRRIDLSIQPANLLRGTASQRLLEDSWVCAVWRGNRAVKTRITQEQICTLPHASIASGRTTLAERLIAPLLGRTPVVHVVTQSFVPLPFLLRGTGLIALIQRSLGTRVQDCAEIRMLELPLALPPLVFEMSWNPLYATDPAHTWLRSVVLEVAQASCGSQDAATSRKPST
jgi:DNA-binding transcriptional LysR family regulator